LHQLFRLRSLDCWLSYVALKDTVIHAVYSPSAFLRRALSAYRSQFDRLIAAVQPISLLPIHRIGANIGQPSAEAIKNSQPEFDLIPSRLPSDSRVPKSSSIPSRLFDHASGNEAPAEPVSQMSADVSTDEVITIVHTKIISEADVQLVEVAKASKTIALNVVVERPVTLQDDTGSRRTSPPPASPTPSLSSRIPVLKVVFVGQ
jgi:hypothetical protein